MKKYATEIKWGLIFVASLLLWMIFERVIGMHDKYIEYHPYIGWGFTVIAFIIYGLALTEKKKKDLGGNMTWKQGFISGLIIAAVVTILAPLSQWIISTIITPDYFKNAIEHAVNSGNATREQAEQNFNLGSYIIQSTIGTPIFGAVTAAIVAIFTRSKG